VPAADELQKQLLRFKFANHKHLKLSLVPGAEDLHPRARDLYEALALSNREDRTLCRCGAEFFKAQQESNREPLSPTQSALLQTLSTVIHSNSNKGTYYVQSLMNGVNADLEAAGERLRGCSLMQGFPKGFRGNSL
jgi:hypothetical protein